MSLLRGSRSSAGRKPPKARRKKPPAKQEWDGTVQDLTVHRATPEELVRRHEMHKSKNKALVRSELQEKALKSKLKQQRPRIPESLEKKKLAIMREILSDQYHLQDVLERSDQAMAVVKDLFGDAPRRRLGFPNVTVAPNCDGESTRRPIVQKCDLPTQLSILSESVMDPQALNEVEESSSVFPLEGENVQDVSFSSKFSTDTNRTLHFLKEKISVADCQEKAIKQQANTASSQDASMLATPIAGLPSQDCTALNATNVVKRVHSRLENEEHIANITYIVQQVLNANLKKQKQISAKVKKPQTVLMPDRQKRSHLSSAASTFSPAGGRVSNLDILNQMMHDVEQEMDEYEQWTGHKVQQAPNGHGLSGFTYSLVNAVCRVMRFLKETEARLRQEALNRQQLEGEVSEQRALVDALTAEILLVREENLALQAKLQQYMVVTDEQLTSLTCALNGLSSSESNRMRNPGETGGLSVQRPEVVQGKPLLNYVGLTTDLFSGEKMPELSQRGLPSQGPALPNPPDSAGVGQISSATLIQPVVLLTPPQQKDSQAPLPLQDESTGRQLAQEERSTISGKPLIMLQDGALFPQRGRSLIAAGDSQNFLQPDVQPVKSAFSAVLRPGLGGFAERLSPGPPMMCMQDEDLQGQIAELTFQNSMIRAQLSKFQQAHQEAGDSLEQRGPAQNASDKEGRETSQAVSNLKEPPKSLDERIAELNHQSAEARSRLLQLISQQKLATSVSPPISPIPSPPVILNKTGRRKIEVSVPVAETLDSSKEDSLSPANGTSARRSSGASSQRNLPQSAVLRNAPLIAETHKLKAEKQREEGWFALSVHTG